MSTRVPTRLAARFTSACRSFGRDERGATLVEFGLIAAPFFFLIFGLLEVCLVFIMSTVLEHAVAEASRPLRTGEAQEAGINEEQFRLSVCGELMGMLECDGRLHIDVKTISTFSAAGANRPIDGDGNFDDAGFTYEPGGPNDIVAVRVFYEWNLITPWISKPLANMAGNRHLLQASAVFRNEPFGT